MVSYDIHCTTGTGTELIVEPGSHETAAIVIPRDIDYTSGFYK